MAHKTGNMICRSFRFEVSTVVAGVMKFPYHPEHSRPLSFGYFATGSIPAIGSTFTGGGTAVTQLLVHEGPEYAGQFVTPFDCRVVGVAYSMLMTNPDDGCTNVRFGIMHCDFDDEESRTATATWKTLALIDSPTMSGDPASQMQRGAATFDSSNGDVAAGECVGVVVESLGEGSGICNGSITIMLEAR